MQHGFFFYDTMLGIGLSGIYMLTSILGIRRSLQSPSENEHLKKNRKRRRGTFSAYCGSKGASSCLSGRDSLCENIATAKKKSPSHPTHASLSPPDQRKRDKWKTPGPQLGHNPDRGGQRKRDKWYVVCLGWSRHSHPPSP